MYFLAYGPEFTQKLLKKFKQTSITFFFPELAQVFNRREEAAPHLSRFRNSAGQRLGRRLGRLRQRECRNEDLQKVRFILDIFSGKPTLVL